MMNFTFTGKPEQKANIPYFEDTRAKETKYYSSTKTLAQAMKEVKAELTELGAYNIAFAEGYFGVKPKRYGYLITFGWNGAPGKIPLCGLPIKSEFGRGVDTKIAKVRIQALLILRDVLISYRQSPIFMVDSEPMLQHILVDGKHTVYEYLKEFNQLPALPALADGKGDVVEAEFVEER